MNWVRRGYLDGHVPVLQLRPLLVGFGRLCGRDRGFVRPHARRRPSAVRLLLFFNPRNRAPQHTGLEHLGVADHQAQEAISVHGLGRHRAVWSADSTRLQLLHEQLLLSDDSLLLGLLQLVFVSLQLHVLSDFPQYFLVRAKVPLSGFRRLSSEGRHQTCRPVPGGGSFLLI